MFMTITVCELRDTPLLLHTTWLEERTAINCNGRFFLFVVHAVFLIPFFYLLEASGINISQSYKKKYLRG